MIEDNIYNEMAMDEEKYIKNAEKELLHHHKIWATELEENVNKVKESIDLIRVYAFHGCNDHNVSLWLKKHFRDISLRLSVIETISKDMQ